MRKSLNELTATIRRRLRKDEEVSQFTDVIIPVEIMAVGFDLIGSEETLDKAWTLLTRYDEPVLPKNLSKDVLVRIRMLMSSYVGEANWLSLLESYREVVGYQRLLEFDDQYHFTFKAPRIDPDRKEIYKGILLNPIPYKKTNKTFAKGGKFSYVKHSRESNIIMSGNIPPHWIKEPELLPEYRQKKQMNFAMDFDWPIIAKEMDRKLSVPIWKERLSPIQFHSIDDKQSVFHYEGLQHIAGGLASGKSTFRMINTYWLVKYKNAKIGMIEGSVADVLSTVKELRNVGINAVPIIGRSNREFHLTNHLLSKQYHTIDELEDPELKHLSGICSLKALAKDFEHESQPYYPCERIYSASKTQKLCPLIGQCGVFRDWYQLKEADVWVTTSAAVLSAKIPATIDPYKRTIYEAMYDLLDVIYVDEADQVQKRFEEQFLNEYNAFGKESYLVERLDKQFFEQIQHQEQLIGNSYISEWQMNLHHLKENVRELRGRLKTSKHLRNMLRRNVMYLNYLIHEIAKRITTEKSHYEQMKEKLIKYSRQVSFQSDQSEDSYLQLLVRTTNEHDKLAIVKDWIKSAGGEVPAEENKGRNLGNKVELFVYLANIESALKFIKFRYPIIQQYAQVEKISLLSMVDDFRPFIKEAMTGVMFGYRYEQKDGEELGSFKIIQYLAIGRDLLYNWHQMYKKADKRKGPTVLLLSGTSYAPKSLHYHVEHEPNWFISSTRQTSTLTQQFLPVRNPFENEEIINISGVADDVKKDRFLQTMVEQLEHDIQSELTYWGDKGEQRKVLLVVNSYDDVVVVGEALKRSDRWKGNYRLLSRGDQKNDIWYPRTMIERFPDEDVDILVAPMLAISRGYNIMKNNQAYFGSAFFLIRPYPVPNDLSYFVQVLHGHLPIYFKEIEKENLHFVKAMRRLRKKSRAKFEAMYEKPEFWSILTEEERIVLAWYTFIPAWQLIGRLLRSGSDARVFYCDGRFADPEEGKLALLDYWQRIMSETDDEIFNSLYGPFKDGIENVSKGEVLS